MTYTTIAQTINTQLDEILIAHGVNKNTFFATRFFLTRKVCQLNGRFLKKQDDARWEPSIEAYRFVIKNIDGILDLYDTDVIQTAQKYIDPVLQLAAKMVDAEYGNDLAALDMVLRDLVQMSHLHTYKIMKREMGAEAADLIVGEMQNGFATAVNMELALANAA